MPHKIISCFSAAIFPALLIAFIFIYKNDFSGYLRLLDEDELVEWLTFVFLTLAGILSLFIAVRIRKTNKYYFWFFIVFCIFCIFAGLEEISWGQRVFDVDSPKFFMKYSDQQEINAHNTFQELSQIKTKHLAAIILFFYGVCAPLLLLKPRIKDFFHRKRIVVPPRVLVLGFFLGALMMIDKPTGDEEEIGELFFSLSFLLFMVLELIKNVKSGDTIPIQCKMQNLQCKVNNGDKEKGEK